MKNTNALVAKEIRLLLPAYVAALVLAILPVWLLPPFHGADTTFFILCAFWFGIVMLALSSFGREFGMNTFPLLLAQPLGRDRVWRTKTRVLAGAIGTVFFVWCLSSSMCINRESDWSNWLDVLQIGGGVMVTIFAGGLCMTILLRQVAAAFWFTAFIPAAIFVCHQMVGAPPWLECLSLAVYSVITFLFARRQFYNAQEVGWTGGTIALPGWRSGDITRPRNRSHRPLLALFWKEIQLHQVGLAGMAGLFVLHLGAVLWRKQGGNSLNVTLKTGLDVFGGVWFLVPLIFGGTSVAEERKLGTMQAHLTLPVSRKIQFTIKLLAVLLVGSLLSAVLLWTAEGIGSALGAYCGVEILKAPFSTEALSALCWLFLACSLVSFFASTLVGGLIQSFAASVLTGAGFWLLLLLLVWVETVVERRFGFILVSGHLLLLILLPAAVVTLVILSYRNFKTVSESWQLWRRNALTFICVLLGACALVSSVYNRVWELVTPLEPAHGASRITGTRVPILKSFNMGPGYFNGIYGEQLGVLLPDGKLWQDNISYNMGRIWLGFQLDQKWTNLPRNHFASGSNWIETVGTEYETVAIRGDGTLWASETPYRQWRVENGKPEWSDQAPSPLVQFGSETNWQSIARGGWDPSSLVLLKQDGTLWRWVLPAGGDTNDGGKHQPSSWLRVFQPHRLGMETNWERIIGTRGFVYAWKQDGQHWIIYPTAKKEPSSSEVMLEPGTMMIRNPSLDHFKFKSLTAGWNYEAGLDDDGKLWTWIGRTSQPVRLGNDNDWTSLAGDDSRFIARKADGSLWQWDFGTRMWGLLDSRSIPQALHELGNRAPTRLGTHNDWLAIADGEWPQGVIALAADGSLWHWWDDDVRYVNYRLYALNLRPSRRPSLIANIFDN